VTEKVLVDAWMLARAFFASEMREGLEVHAEGGAVNHAVHVGLGVTVRAAM
jgi:hypothetical protein